MRNFPVFGPNIISNFTRHFPIKARIAELQFQTFRFHARNIIIHSYYIENRAKNPRTLRRNRKWKLFDPPIEMKFMLYLDLDWFPIPAVISRSTDDQVRNIEVHFSAMVQSESYIFIRLPFRIQCSVFWSLFILKRVMWRYSWIWYCHLTKNHQITYEVGSNV